MPLWASWLHRWTSWQHQDHSLLLLQQRQQQEAYRHQHQGRQAHQAHRLVWSPLMSSKSAAQMDLCLSCQTILRQHRETSFSSSSTQRYISGSHYSDYGRLTLQQNHSVVQSNFNNPCVPIQNVQPNVTNAFFSGFMPTTASSTATSQVLTYTIRVNDAKPIWFYCAQAKHCQGGMVGAINA